MRVLRACVVGRGKYAASLLVPFCVDPAWGKYGKGSVDREDDRGRSGVTASQLAGGRYDVMTTGNLVQASCLVGKL